MTEEMPAIARMIYERWEAAGLLGVRCTAFIVRGEDLRDLRHWLGIDATLAKTSFKGLPVHGIDAGQGFMAGPVAVVCSEDLQRMEEALPEGSPISLAPLDLGGCWACAVEGVMPRSD